MSKVMQDNINKNNLKGTEIGLVICQKIINKIPGTIEIERKLHKGKNVIITLDL